jgi:hypothetical protein
MDPFGAWDPHDFGVARPLMPYMYFVADVRHIVKEEFPEMQPVALGRHMGMMWDAMSEREREPYRAMSAAARAQYLVDAEAAIARLPRRTQERIIASRRLPYTP